MNETIALTKYVWTRYRIFLSILISVLLLSVTLTTMLSLLHAPMWFINTTASVGFLALLTGLLSSIALFGFSSKSGLLDATSGYDAWLLRMPVENWKLALIPAGLTTVWISMISTIPLVIILIFQGPDAVLAIVSQSLGMSASAIAICSIVWVPVRFAWQRIVLTIVAFPLLTCVGMGAIVIYSSPLKSMMPWVIAGILVCYIVAIGLAYYSVRLARLGSFQQVEFNSIAVASKSASAAVSRSFVDWSDALNWYDTKRTRGDKLLHVLAMSIVVAILTSIMPISAAGVIFTMVIVAAVVGGVVSTRIEPTVWGARSGLPSYLIASPLPSRAIAFVRLRAYATEYTGAMLIMTLMWLSCFAWPSNREAILRWWSSNVATGVSTMAPLRMIAAIYQAILVTMLGLSLRHVCVQLRGRQAFVLFVTAAYCMLLIIPLIGFLTWFIQQRDWDHVSRVGEHWRQWSYQLFYFAIFAKLIFIAVVVSLASRNMFSWREIATAIMSWCVLVVFAAFLWYRLWPLGDVKFITVLMATSLAVPLSVCFTAPLAVQANRHVRVFAPELRINARGT